MDKGTILEAVYQAAGCDADDWLESAEQNTFRCDGGKRALVTAVPNIQSLAVGVKRDLEEGKLGNLESAQVADYAILQITRAADSLANAARHQGNLQLSAQGEIAAYKRLVGYFKSKHEAVVKRRERLDAAVESGEVSLDEDGVAQTAPGEKRVAGARPEPGIAARRKAEARMEPEVSTKEEAIPEPAVPSAPTKKTPVKRRVRKKKAE